MSIFDVLGKLLSSGGGNVVSGLTVTAPRLAGNALGSAVGSAAGQALAQGFGGAIGGQTAPSGQGYDGGGYVDPLTVNADPDQYQLGDPGDSSGWAGVPAMPLANIGSSPPSSPQADSSSTTLDPLTVSVPGGASADFSSPDISGLLSTIMKGFSPGSLPANFGQGLNPDLMSSLQVLAPPAQSVDLPSISVPSGITPQQTLQPVPGLTPDQSGGLPPEAALLGLGGLGALGGHGGLGKLLGVAGGLLPALLLYNSLKDAGKATTANQTQVGNTIDNLGGVANGNQNLVKTLTNKTMANLNGNIGGPMKMAIERNVRAAQAAIRQRYSNMGMSGSTAEAQDLQGAAQAGLETQAKIGQDMATQGLNSIAALTGQSIDAYARILAAQTQQGTALGNAMTSFSGAAATYLGNALGGLLTPAPAAKKAA